MCITNSYVKGKGGKIKKNLTDSPVLFCRSVRLLTRLSTAFFFCVYLFVFHALLQDIADANILNKLSPFFCHPDVHIHPERKAEQGRMAQRPDGFHRRSFCRKTRRGTSPSLTTRRSSTRLSSVPSCSVRCRTSGALWAISSLSGPRLRSGIS